MQKPKKPLYRKVNTTARGVSHSHGSDFSKSRNTKRDSREQVRGSMSNKKNRGLDYTPLLKFLLSKVGCRWDEVYSEAISRLDRTEPIFWIVAMCDEEKEEYVRIGDNSYYSGLFVDTDGILQLTNPRFKASDLTPSCSCCTHSFNGKVFGN